MLNFFFWYFLQRRHRTKKCKQHSRHASCASVRAQRTKYIVSCFSRAGCPRVARHRPPCHLQRRQHQVRAVAAVPREPIHDKKISSTLLHVSLKINIIIHLPHCFVHPNSLTHTPQPVSPTPTHVRSQAPRRPRRPPLRPPRSPG